MDSNTSNIFHSVTLDPDKCMGCVTCVKRCPTEAIRVRDGKASIINEYCIDCGECIRVCPHHAKHAIYDPLTVIQGYRRSIALPAPALYGQFSHIESTDIVLNALLKLGFDDVFEVARAAEIVSDRTRQIMEEEEDLPKPLISCACPAVVRLIRVEYPELIGNLMTLVPPVELAARLAARKAMVEHPELAREDIGVIFITPCPAKVTSMRAPLGFGASEIDASVAMKEVYPKLLEHLPEIAEIGEMNLPELQSAGRVGVSWSGSGGEATALLTENYLAADGMENVVHVLDSLEEERLGDLDFIELNACAGGCVGGVLTVENPYIAHTRVQKLRKFMPVSLNHFDNDMLGLITNDEPIDYVNFVAIQKLSDDYEEAISLLAQMKEIEESLPGIDCGACGAPSCAAFAEDVIRGNAKKGECIISLRDRLGELAEDDEDIGDFIPRPFRSGKENRGDDNH
ncbi:MAG: 4Fe-4S binding protein [Clostridiales Family XIII bacterium]|jgi:iron only hydrogenase large subunit-like protein|nr:4Fe-4S binding protein [Clostridiales Family XIII bacterium]